MSHNQRLIKFFNELEALLHELRGPEKVDPVEKHLASFIRTNPIKFNNTVNWIWFVTALLMIGVFLSFSWHDTEYLTAVWPWRLLFDKLLLVVILFAPLIRIIINHFHYLDVSDKLFLRNLQIDDLPAAEKTPKPAFDFEISAQEQEVLTLN